MSKTWVQYSFHPIAFFLVRKTRLNHDTLWFFLVLPSGLCVNLAKILNHNITMLSEERERGAYICLCTIAPSTIFCRITSQARSQVWIWGVFCFRRKWTFKHAFGKKVDFLACSFGDSGLFSVLFWEKVDFFACFLGESGLFWAKYVQNCGPFWTLWDHGEVLSHSPWLWAWNHSFIPTRLYKYCSHSCAHNWLKSYL